jgi:hypothetical protein
MMSDSPPVSARTSVTGSQKYGIDMLIRAASAIGNSSASIGFVSPVRS